MRIENKGLQEYWDELKLWGRILMAAIVMRPQNYWMTYQDRLDALKTLGFEIDENGEFKDIKNTEPKTK